MVKSDHSELNSENQDASDDLADVNNDTPTEESEKGEEEQTKPRLPKWAKILLMILPALIYVTIIVLVDQFVGFPATVSANAIIALTGIGLLGFVVIGDMLYRNLFVSRMLRRETKKSRIYKEILKDKKEAQKDRSRFEELDEDYSYEDDDEEIEDELEVQEEFEEEYDEEDEEYEEEEEYQYDYEEEDESKYYRTRSLAVRGGIFSILIINSLIIIVAAVFLQIFLYGGFVIPSDT